MKATVVDGLEVGTGLPSLTVRFSRERLVRYAGASTDSDGVIANATYDWDFGDGSPVLQDGGPTPSHTFATAGDKTVTLTITDDEGCSTETVFTGQTASCSGNPLASITVPIKVLNPTGPKLQVRGSKRQRLRRVVVRARCPQCGKTPSIHFRLQARVVN